MPSGNYMHHLLQLWEVLHLAFYTVCECIVWFSQPFPIMFLNSANWLVSVVDENSVLCEAETEFYA